MRQACMYILLHPEELDPPHGLDLEPGSRDSLKVERLQAAFVAEGFDHDEPALVGYPLAGRVQLLSGTHRHEAARRVGMLLPVRLVLRSVVEASWGKPEWEEVIRDIPVRELHWAPVKDSAERRGDTNLAERIDLTASYEEESECS